MQLNCDRLLNVKKWDNEQRRGSLGAERCTCLVLPPPLRCISLWLGWGDVLSETNPFVLEGGVGCCRAALADTSTLSKTPVTLSACWQAGMAGGLASHCPAWASVLLPEPARGIFTAQAAHLAQAPPGTGTERERLRG